MISRQLAARLGLDTLSLGLLVAGLAYYWLDNTAHEVIGSALFALLLAHNLFNRRWYGRAATGLRRPRNAVNAGVTLLLAVSMLALLATSVMISQTVFAMLAPTGGSGHASSTPSPPIGRW